MGQRGKGGRGGGVGQGVCRIALRRRLKYSSRQFRMWSKSRNRKDGWGEEHELILHLSL